MRLLTCLVLALFLLVPGSAAADTAAPVREGSWPLVPRPDVVSGFDPPATVWGAGHRGVDLLGHVGQQVQTSLAGTVTFAAVLAGRGVVVVDHGGVRTTYEPVSASVATGDVVSRGQVVGTLQRASSHCFPRACLHWGLRQGDTYLDPLTLVGAGPVRLLPLGGSMLGGRLLGAGP
jgi:murein DD-endopeptidase MepM/ murein hydrolase activator NlpD